MSAYALVQVDERLYRVNPDGTQIAITLPQGVTVSSFLPVRGAVLNRRLVLTNGVSRNVQIDANVISRLLQPRAPSAAPTAAAGAAGVLTGDYQWKYTHAIMEGDVVISESDFSPASTAVTLSADQGSLTGIAVSVDPGVNARRIYRTSSSGSTFFLVTTVYDNTSTTYTDNATDESLDLFPAEESIGPAYGTTEGTRFKLIATWKDRLWAVPDLYPDRVHFSGNRIQYGWNEDYYFVAGADGEDFVGVTALAARKNELFIGKRRSLHKISGDSVEDFGIINIPSTIGVWATESVKVIRDAVYFLAEDGVYRWDGRLTNLSADRLHTWFNEADASRGGVFNLALAERAFAHYNQKFDAYELYLPSTNSLGFDRWVSLDLQTGEWLGPHKTDAYTPTCASEVDDTTARQRPAVGSSVGGVWFKNRATTYNDGSSAIDMEFTTNPMHQGEPQLEKFWGQLETHTQPESGGTLTVRAKVGDLDAPQGTVAVVSITRVGSTATVVTNGPHNFGTGQAVAIAGGTGLSVDYNGIWEIVRTGSTSFTFDVGTATPETPANGTITALLPVRGDLSADLTLDRNRLGRLGVGRYCQLTFKNAEADRNTVVRGFEIDPVNILGRR